MVKSGRRSPRDTPTLAAGSESCWACSFSGAAQSPHPHPNWLLRQISGPPSDLQVENRFPYWERPSSDAQTHREANLGPNNSSQA